MKSFRCVVAGAFLCCLVRSVPAQLIPNPGPVEGYEEDEPEAWVEKQVKPPAAPRDADLIEFYVSAAASNKFFLDRKTIGIGTDGVVRYTLVVRSSGGARTVSYEGLRCSTGEIKHYASGRPDGQWSRDPDPKWKEIGFEGANRYHEALWKEYVCKDGSPLASVDDIVTAIHQPKGYIGPNEDIWGR